MPTIRPITTRSGSCVAEREPAGGQGQDVFGLFALWRAYRACRKGKRNTRDTQRYEAGLPDQLVSARNRLASSTWQPSRTLAFVVSSPKLREIHAAPFADRVVHHLLADRLARIYEPVFIHDSYANRLGKGTHAAVERLQGFMRAAGGQALSNKQRFPEVYALQLDIANFFNCIHRPSLFRLIQARLLRAVRRLFAHLAEFERKHVRADAQHFALRLLPAERDLLRARLASFLGHLRHANSFVLWQQTLARFPWLRLMFDLPVADGREGSKTLPLRPTWEPPSVSGLAGQYRYFVKQYPDSRVLMQVGKHWLASGASAARATRWMAGAVRVHRTGLGACEELPAHRLAALRRKLKRAGIAHVLAGQTGHFKTGYQRRALKLLWRPFAARASPASPSRPPGSAATFLSPTL